MSESSVPDVVRENVYEAPEGLEDFDPRDGIIPILKLDHDSGLILDGLSGKKYNKLEVICVGLVKQRVLWPAEVQEGDQSPLCKSYNFKVGHPDAPNFPWEAAHFTPDADVTELPCESCNLKEWGTHPGRDIPWCSEQHTYAILQQLNEDLWAPALMTFQRSGLKASNTYLSSFVRAQEPLYVCKTLIELDERKRGNVEFLVPKFSRGDDTDQSKWPYYAETYRQIRTFVQTPRRLEEEETASTETPDQAVGATPAAATPPTQPAPEPAAAAAAPSGGDDLPF